MVAAGIFVSTARSWPVKGGFLFRTLHNFIFYTINSSKLTADTTFANLKGRSNVPGAQNPMSAWQVHEYSVDHSVNCKTFMRSWKKPVGSQTFLNWLGYCLACYFRHATLSSVERLCWFTIDISFECGHTATLWSKANEARAINLLKFCKSPCFYGLIFLANGHTCEKHAPAVIWSRNRPKPVASYRCIGPSAGMLIVGDVRACAERTRGLQSICVRNRSNFCGLQNIFGFVTSDCSSYANSVESRTLNVYVAGLEVVGRSSALG